MFKKIFFISLIAFFLFPTSTKAAEQIDNFESKITIFKSSQIEVVEKIEYDFGTIPKHGIIRKIPITKTNSDGKKYKAVITFISVRDENGTGYPFTQTNLIDYAEIKIGDANKTIIGKHTYIITYVFQGAIQNYSDHDELYWNVTGNEWNVPIQKSTATLGFNEGVPSINFNKLSCFAGIMGSKLTNCTVSEYGKDFAMFSTTTPLASNEGLTIVTSMPKGILTPFFMDEVKNKSLNEFLLLIPFFVLVNLLGFIILFFIWFFKGRDPQSQIIVRQYEPPKDLTGKFLTPMEVGVVVDEVINPRDMSAEIINLAIKKYIKITETEKEVLIFKTKEIKFERGKSFTTDPGFKNISESENETLKALNLIDNEWSLLSELKNSAPKSMQTIKSAMYKKVVTDGYFKNNPDSIRAGYMVLGFALFFFGNFVLGIGLILFSKIMPRKTSAGSEAKRQALGLKQYLVSQDRQFEYMEKNYDLFEKLLPYAIVFGVAKIWAEKFKDLSNYQPNWYNTNSTSNMLNSAILVDSLSKNLSTMEGYYTPTSSSSSHGFSSGFSGGSSGGGFGGGGGGSW